jgi:hypothetical protein
MRDVLKRFRRDFFPNTEWQLLSFEIMSEDWQKLLALFADNELNADEALRYALAAGQAYTSRERESPISAAQYCGGRR